MDLLVLFFVLLLSSSSISRFTAAVTSSSLISPSFIECEYWFKVDEHGDQVNCRVGASEVIVLTKEVLSRAVVRKLNSNNNYTIQNYPGIISVFLVEVVSGNLTIKADALAVLMPNLTKLSVQNGQYVSPETKPRINVAIDQSEVLLREMPEFRNISTWGRGVYTNDTLRAILANGSSLQELTLGSGQFPGGLTSGVFGELKNLRHLTLFGENFTHDGAAGGGGGLELGAFEGLANLRVLILAANQINHLPDGLFRDLGKVEHLDLSMNELEAIGNDSFLGLVSLSELKLQLNPIKLIEPRSFASLQNLRSLDLQRARIAYFPESVLSAQRALSKLNINGNTITNLSSTTFANLENLEVLEMSLCERLELIEPGSFDRLIKLRDLYMTHNRRLRHLPDGLFENMNKLENAFFMGDCVDNLFPSNFTHCPRMVYLKIDTCA